MSQPPMPEYPPDNTLALEPPKNGRTPGVQKTELATGSKRTGRRKYKMSTEDYIDLYKEWGYQARLNLCNDDIEMSGKPYGDVEIAYVQARVRDYANNAGMSANIQHCQEAMTIMADRNSFHPVKDYLESLEWDEHLHIEHLASYFKDETGDFGRWLQHWLVGSVARVYEGFQNPMLVLAGGQDLGKSFFARWLCPVPDMFLPSSIVPEYKDHKLRLIQVWIWEVEELGSTTRKADVDALKAFLTLGTVRERKSYGRRDIIKPALASFIGTLNPDAGFLVDRTGNRRFLTCSLTEIDWAYSSEVNVEQVWAQAMHTYKTTDDWKLTGDEKARRDESNMEHMVDCPVEAYLSREYRFTGDANDIVDLPDILDTLSGYNIHPNRATTMRVASVLKSWGAQKGKRQVRGERASCYKGVISTEVDTRPINFG